MKKNKQNGIKGITIISLSVTIIVLLLLAGISLIALRGNDGAVKKAETAKQVTDLGDLKEDINLVLANHEVSQNTLEQDLKNKFGESAVVRVENLTDTFYVTRDGNTVTVYGDGDIIDGMTKIWDGSTYSKPVIDKNFSWHIYTPEQLYFFEKFVNKDATLTAEDKEGVPEITTSTNVYLENNLDMGARETNGNWETDANLKYKWNPIGKLKDNAFVGTFYGQNHSIRGLYINEEEVFTGLFGNCYSVEDLTIKDSYVKNSDWITGSIVGALRGGRLYNCNNIGTPVHGGSNVEKAYSYTGGIVGQSQGTVEKCCNYSEVTGESITIGGIVGMNAATVTGCTNYGDINGKQNNMIGGIVGQSATKSTVTGCGNYGDVKGTADVGGISGTMVRKNASNDWSKSTIEKSYNSGNIEGDTDVGGIVGNVSGGAIGNGTLTQCYNKGKVSAASNVGEITGRVSCSTIVETIVDNQAGNKIKDLLWMKGVNDGLSGIGNMTFAEDNAYDIKPTVANYQYEEWISLWN